MTDPAVLELLLVPVGILLLPSALIAAVAVWRWWRRR